MRAEKNESPRFLRGDSAENDVLMVIMYKNIYKIWAFVQLMMFFNVQKSESAKKTSLILGGGSVIILTTITACTLGSRW